MSLRTMSYIRPVLALALVPFVFACSTDDEGDQVGTPQENDGETMADGSGGSSDSDPVASGGTDGTSSGGTTTMEPPDDSLLAWQQAALDEHNAKRALHCAPDLTWNAEAAAFAQNWAKGLCGSGGLEHSQGSGFGENLYSGWTSGAHPSESDAAITAVTNWYNEIDLYDYNSPGFGFDTGHFTQVVWEGTTSVGCGVAQCVDGEFNATVVSCNYAPPGNFGGQYEANVPPLCQ